MPQQTLIGKNVIFQTKTWCALALFWLTGCATVPAVVEMPLPAKERQQKLASLTHFELTASLGVKAPNDSVSGSLQHMTAQLRVNVTSPGGTTAAALAVLMPELPGLMARAVKAAADRGRELGK